MIFGCSRLHLCKSPRCPLIFRIALALVSLSFLIAAGGRKETVVRCNLLGSIVGLAVLAAFGVWMIFVVAKYSCDLPVDVRGVVWWRFMHLLDVCSGVFMFFALASVTPILLVQSLVCLAASSIAMMVGSALLHHWWMLAWWRGLCLFAIGFWGLAYLVLLLHREVDGQFGGLSATLSREEHLVLFSFGGFLISTGAWFVALLLPCGRRALEGEKVVKEHSVSRYPSKEDPVEELVSSDTVVEIGMEDPAQVAASDQEEADSAAQPAPADLPGEVAPSSDEESGMEDKPAAKPAASPTGSAAPFPFPRGPSRPRREEAWSSPRAGLSAVPEGDETEGEVLTEVTTRCNVRSFLAQAPAPLEDPSEAFETAPPMEDCIEADSPEGLPPEAPCEDLDQASELQVRSGRSKLGLQALGVADISLNQIGRAFLVSLTAHTCAGLILLLAGYILVVLLVLLSLKLFFLLAAWLDMARLPDPKQVEDQSPTEISLASSPNTSPLAKVPESYAASWGFFPPQDGPREKLGMPPVQEEDISEKDEREEAEAQGPEALRNSAREVQRPGGARPGRRRPQSPLEAQLQGHPESLAPHLFVSAWSEVFELQATPGDLVATKAKVPCPPWLSVAAVSTPLAVVLIVLLHAVVLFFVFIFDLVFIEKYATSGLSRHFILAAVNATCVDSQRLQELGAFQRPSECAREVLRSTDHMAFSLGPAVEGVRSCYPQLGIEEASFQDVFYGGQSFCPWMPSPGFDLFVIEKQQPCSILGRGTSLIVGNATALSHQVSDDLPAVVSSCEACRRVMETILALARALLHSDVLLQHLLAGADAVRRLGAAGLALGAAAAALLVLLLDVCALLALGREALSLRVGVPLVRYATACFVGQVLEQFIVLLLHCIFMAGMAFQLELANDFWPELHCTRDRDVTEGDYNLWHQAVRWTATALVFFAASASFLLSAVLLGGFSYRSNALARWSVSAVCAADVQLSDFWSECLEWQEVPETLSLTALGRPLLGALASLGLWHRRTSVIFQVVKRMDWYLPAMPEMVSPVFPSDCVSWNAMARATVHGLSISWLLLPYGGLVARSCLYLNECILLTSGTDGGGTADEPDQLSHHVLEDSQPILHLARWAAACGHLANLLVLLSVDFFDLPAKRRERLIWDLLLAGVVLSFLRSSLGLLEALLRYWKRRGLVAACCHTVLDSLPSRVVQSHVRAQQKTLPRSRSEEEADALGIRPWRTGPSGKTPRARLPVRSIPEREEDFLFGLSSHERERVVLACRELLQLSWVQSAHLPGRLRAKLAAARSSRSGRVRLAEALQGQGVPRGWLLGAQLLVLREVAEEDLCMESCAVEAKQVVSHYLRQHCTMQAAKLQLWLQAHAKSQVARWAAALWNSGAVGDLLQATDEAAERVEESWGVKSVRSAEDEGEAEEARSSARTEMSDGFKAASFRSASMRSTPWRAGDAPQSLRMLFAVTQRGLVSVSGHWAAGGREILAQQQASVNITAQAEVVIHWPRTGVSSNNVQVEFISHQIWPPLPPKPEPGSHPNKRSERQKNIARRRLGTAWAERKELQWTAWPGGCCKAASDEEEEHMDALWRIRCRVDWGEVPCENDADKDVPLLTELGAVSWATPMALPALGQRPRRLDRSERYESGSDAATRPRSALRCRSRLALGCRVAALVGGGPVGLLGPVAKVPQDPSTLSDELCQAAYLAAWTATCAAARTPKEALQMLEVAMCRNPQRISSAFFAALYAGIGGLCQVEVRRRSWLMAAAVRRMHAHKARLQSTQCWTCQGRKRWLRSSERARMGLTFLGNMAQAGEDVGEDGPWHDASPERRRSHPSEGTSSDKVRPFSRPSTPPVVVMEVEDFDAGESGGPKHLDFLDKVAKDPRMLAKALEEARPGSVSDTKVEQLLSLERAALGLLEAVQSGSIRQLSSRLSMARELGLDNAAFPDAAGVGVLQLALEKLEEEKAAVPLRLAAALRAFGRDHHGRVGVIALQRCIDQARAAESQDHVKIYKVEAKLHLLCERKREIALLKAAMTVEDAWLLKAATEECRQRFGDSFGVDLTLAKCQLEIWESQEETGRSGLRPEALRHIDGEEKARAALRAAMFHEPPQAELLRLAIARARRAGVDVQPAEELLQEEREVEQALEQLRRASAARDVRALRRAIADCADVGVEEQRLQAAATQLVEALGELQSRAQQHELCRAAQDLERERQELQSTLEMQSGLRSICRVRPPLAQELQEALRMSAGLTPVLRRVDRRTLEVALDGSYATCDFSAVLGPESTAAEVYGELSGLAQATVHGRDVAVLACGPPGAGTSYTLCGSPEQPGVVPQLLDEVFALKGREQWRSEIHFDVQALELDEVPTDLLTGEPMADGILPEAAATRRVEKVQELKELVQEIWQRPCRSERCALLILHMRRTNRHTGLALRSRLLVADLAGHALDAAEAMAALHGKASTAASGEVLPALLRDGHALVALVVCLPPTAKDRDEVLAVLEALGLRQSWAQTAETRRFQVPQPLPPGTPKLPPSPHLDVFH